MRINGITEFGQFLTRRRVMLDFSPEGRVLGAKPAYAFMPRAANLDEQVRFARLTKSCIQELEDSAARALAAACPPLSRLAVPDLPSDLITWPTCGNAGPALTVTTLRRAL